MTLRFSTYVPSVLCAAAFALVSLVFVPLAFVQGASAQQIVNYGADFLAGGVGGRALGMGGAHVAAVRDVDAVYWNPAGLSRMRHPEVAYMHAERFAGVVSFDYGSLGWPINERSTFGVSFYRSGVNDIKNTLDAWDPERDQPRPNPDDHISTFSAADAAVFVSYARRLRSSLSIGASAKIIRRNIGAFAKAWGYSFDVGVQYRLGSLMLGGMLQDAGSMRQSWSVDRDRLANIENVFGQELPAGGVEVVLPVLRLGSAYALTFGDHAATVSVDTDLAFDGQRSFVLNTGAVSYHPRLGVEYEFKEVVALRAGLTDVLRPEGGNWDVSPTIGAGLHLRHLSFDYGFGDFAGLASDLGFSHRLSARLTLARSEWERSGD